MLHRIMVALALFAGAGFLALALPGEANAQSPAQKRYLACKQKLQKDPPCDQRWTSACALRCGAKDR